MWGFFFVERHFLTRGSQVLGCKLAGGSEFPDMAGRWVFELNFFSFTSLWQLLKLGWALVDIFVTTSTEIISPAILFNQPGPEKAGIKPQLEGRGAYMFVPRAGLSDFDLTTSSNGSSA